MQARSPGRCGGRTTRRVDVRTNRAYDPPGGGPFARRFLTSPVVERQLFLPPLPPGTWEQAVAHAPLPDILMPPGTSCRLAAGSPISMLSVLRAVQSGIPRVAIARMMTNIAIDTFIGSVPILGDAFDFAY